MKKVAEFRAWEPMSEMGREGSMSYEQGFCLHHLLNPDEITVMQYTGVDDHKGEKIYVGDVVRIKSDDDEEATYSQIKFEMGAFTVDYDFGDYSVTAIGWAMDNLGYSGGQLKVVGNIYENPELLKKLI